MLLFGLVCCTAETVPPETLAVETGAPRDSAPVAPGDTADGTDPGGSAAVELLDPTLVDPAVTVHNGQHVIGTPADGDRRDALLLFFPGTRAEPRNYLRFLTHATNGGFHVVGLSYDNRDSINFDVCREVDASERCHRDARLEVLLGEPSPYTPPDTDPTNGALPRLEGVLSWLGREHPDDGWDTFLDGDDVRFEIVTTAGHSQGGGHAAFTARLHEVARAILFDATEAAEWTTEPVATPSDRLYGVVHTDEFGALAMQRSWDQLGMPAGSTDLTDPLPDSPSGHRFVIVRGDCTGDGNARLHNCAVADDFLPPDNDSGPVFAPLWSALLGL